MSYRDEELLQMRQKIEEFKKQQTAKETIDEELKQSIHAPVVYITKIPVKFEDLPLVDGRITMRVPKDFEPLPPAVIDQVFYMQNKPQFVYENPYLPFSLTFTLTSMDTDDAKTEVMFPYMLSTVKKVGPGVRVLSTGKKMVHDLKLRWFESVSKTITEPSYRKVFIFTLDNKLTICNMVCPSSFMERYKPIMDEMIDTLQITAPETKEGVQP